MDFNSSFATKFAQGIKNNGGLAEFGKKMGENLKAIRKEHYEENGGYRFPYAVEIGEETADICQAFSLSVDGQDYEHNELDNSIYLNDFQKPILKSKYLNNEMS